jgi:superfamily II DNA or RNA helicase
VLGLTATPIRRDGQQPVIFMQCGPVRHTAQRPGNAPQDLEVVPCFLTSNLDVPADAAIQEVFRCVAADAARTDAIAAEVEAACQQGRKVLVLTERTDHLDAIAPRLAARVAPLFVLHGRMSRKDRNTLLDALDALPPDAPRVLLATGRLIGEGFDHPPLDTLVLAMPVSWKGTLQQYAGRLHREHAAKAGVRIIDFVDVGYPVLLRMWDRRQRGYRAMGYRVADSGSLLTD